MKDINDDIFNSSEIIEENSPSVTESPETADEWYRTVYAENYRHVIAVCVPDVIPLRKSHLEISTLIAKHIKFILEIFCPRVSNYQIVNTSLGFDRDRSYYSVKDTITVDKISDKILYEHPYHPGFTYQSEPYPGILHKCNNRNDIIVKFAIDFYGSIHCFLYMCCAIQNIHAYKVNPSQILLYKRKYPEDEALHPFSQNIAPERVGGLTTNTIPSISATCKIDRDFIKQLYKKEHVIIQPSNVCSYYIDMLLNTFVFTGLFAYTNEHKEQIIKWFDRNVPEDIS